MGTNTRKICTKNIPVFLICAFVCATTVILLSVFTGATYVDKENYQKLDDGWTITINGTSYEPSSLEEFTFEQTNPDDVVVLQRKLSSLEGKTIDYPVLRLYSIHSTVEVQLDNEMLYTYGIGEYEEGKAIGYGYHNVPLPSDYEARLLSITYVVVEKNAFNGIQALEISDQLHLFINTLADSRYRFAASMFLLVFGTLISVIVLPLILHDIKNIKLFSLGMLSLMMGIWTLCNSDLISLFSSNLLVKLYAEYLSIYFLPIPLLLYYYDKIMEKKTAGFLKKIYLGLIAVQVFFFVFAFTVHMMNCIHLPRLLTHAHLLMAIDLLYVSVYTVSSLLTEKREHMSYYMGTFLIIGFCVIELIRYNIYKYILHFGGNRYQASLCIGALILIIALFYDYAKGVSYILRTQTRQEVLEMMVYKDELTGLANRRKCDESLEKLMSQNFAIISMDLNNLKHYNDNYGHDKGDQLLRSFADVLRESFPDPMLPTRIGGDEFFVLLSEPQSYEVDEIVKKFRENLKRFNEEHEDLKLFTAIGVVTKEDFSENADVHIVCKEADRRMYENKRRMKKEDVSGKN